MVFGWQWASHTPWQGKEEAVLLPAVPGDAGTRLQLAQAQHPQATLRTWIAASPATHLFTLQEASYAGLDFFFFFKEK